MVSQEWRARLVEAALEVINSRQRCYDSDNGLSESFDDVDREALDKLAAVLSEQEN